jgi:recombination protein RecA
MADVASTLKGFQKKHGDRVVSKASEIPLVDRIPTGLFPLDLALGGGIPQSRLTVIYGQEGSGKTNLTFNIIRNHQMLWPDKICVFVDVENAFDPEWTVQFGVDVDKLFVIRSDFAEEYVDQMVELLKADDIGLIVVDSLAAMVASKDYENSSETMAVGGSARLQTLFAKKIVTSMSRAEREGRSPTVVAINQIRYKIGVRHGDPETQPGGKALMHTAALVLRLYGKPVMDAKILADLPIARDTTFKVKKRKFKGIADSGAFEMVTFPHKGLKVGEANDWSTILAYLKQFEQMEKSKKGWMMLGKEYPTQDAARKFLDEDPVFKQGVRQAIIDRVCKENGLTL